MLFKWVMGVVSKQYRNILSARLKNAGLKYDDLLIESTDTVKAIGRTPRATLLERERRIKRAFDASVKRKAIPEECHNYDPFDFYLSKQISRAEFERVEKTLLDSK